MARKRPRMLIVAADPTLRFTLEEILQYYGYDAATAASRAEAATLIAHDPFEQVLLVLGQNELGSIQPVQAELDEHLAAWPDLLEIPT